jgi:hypothetical protein
MRSDRDYYYLRAEAELAQAQRSTSAAAVKAHYTLAGHYLDRVYGDGSLNDDDDAPPADTPATS